MRVAIDTGGTFTDCLFLRGGGIEILKLPSTPGNPAQAIANALEKILTGASPADCRELDLLWGTTVVTNAVAQITPKFEELNRRAAIENHRHRNAFRRRIRGSENFLSLNRGLKVVYFKRYVRD
jgi:N-methylhydantoinase A/oxoprolinase/acetone carboxylase beta subunit